VDKFDHGDAGGGRFVLGRLRKHTQYEVVVQVVNIYGEGPMSRPSTARTLEDGKTWQMVRVRALNRPFLQLPMDLRTRFTAWP